ncbi:MAG: SMI1/KNR4 family protein [Kineosporiaceae bacterium]
MTGLSPTDALAALVRRCPPPDGPAGPPGDWDAVQDELGVALPADYRGFVDAYGLVRLDDFLLVHSPFAARGPGNLLHEAQDPLGALAGYAERRTLAGEADLPVPPYPAPGGLLPVGRTDNGDELWWVTGDAPDAWPVALLESRGRAVRTVAPSLAGLLLGLVERRLRVPEFPDRFPGERPRFVPAGS